MLLLCDMLLLLIGPLGKHILLGLSRAFDRSDPHKDADGNYGSGLECKVIEHELDWRLVVGSVHFLGCVP